MRLGQVFGKGIACTAQGAHHWNYLFIKRTFFSDVCHIPSVASRRESAVRWYCCCCCYCEARLYCTERQLPHTSLAVVVSRTREGRGRQHGASIHSKSTEIIISSWRPQEVVLYVCFRTATTGASMHLREIGIFSHMATILETKISYYCVSNMWTSETNIFEYFAYCIFNEGEDVDVFITSISIRLKTMLCLKAILFFTNLKSHQIACKAPAKRLQLFKLPA